MSVVNIKAALSEEIKNLQTFAVFKITKITQTNQGLLFDLQGKPSHGAATATPLTEDFVNAGACWYSTTSGSANVSWVDPNKSQVRLVNVKKNFPKIGDDFLLYLPDFIKPVLRLWEENDLAKEAISCLDDLRQPKFVKSTPLSAEKYPFLRSAQLHALTLPTHSSSFLFGPPGTGKTTTLAVVIAEYLVSNPLARVLLVSTTNLAVDQLLVAIDKILEQGNETRVRRQLHRFGSGYDRNQYVEREHLLSKNCAFISTADEAGDDEYGNTSVSLKQVRTDDPGGNVRLYAMTISSCMARLPSLREREKFGLMVLDEASQIGLPQTLLVMTLGQVSIIGGDSEQLAPIATSKTQSVQRWLARSAFAFMPTTGPSTCFLNEQSRMAGPICRIVSEIFYGGLLRVADDALADQRWLKSRTRPMGDIPASEHISIQHIASGATRSGHRNGWFRLESAQRIMDLVLSALKDGHAKESDIVIITPYRLQRAYLLEQLSMLGVPKIKVSTVHSCQGSEAPFVIFDPVCGDDEFLMGQAGRQLINVAISRAQAKLVVMLSAQDLQNPIFSKIVAIAKRDSNPMTQVLAIPQFPQA